ncbi:hypothetical protein CDD81_1775 [Ophiocordyceps australis]|uniref:Uncharacterized protein n=1 Tax=Ophiocordyceps australis TaxID=1399860 RepID=A0A2C5XB67_9HYPO|nr:hypothetical protein CDD81_1775 [Ophiocordyceps australis]
MDGPNKPLSTTVFIKKSHVPRLTVASVRDDCMFVLNNGQWFDPQLDSVWTPGDPVEAWSRIATYLRPVIPENMRPKECPRSKDRILSKRKVPEPEPSEEFWSEAIVVGGFKGF